MGVLSNIQRVNKSVKERGELNKISMETARRGRVESSFLSEYNTFAVGLREVLDNAFTVRQDTSISIKATVPENLKYLNYIFEDDYFKSYYTMTKDVAGGIKFEVKDALDDILYTEEDLKKRERSEADIEMDLYLKS